MTSTHYIVDRLHAKGHTDEWCLENCQPDNPENIDKVEGVNTEICEQSFSRMGRFKYMVQSMTKHTAMIFMNEIVQAVVMALCVGEALSLCKQL